MVPEVGGGGGGGVSSAVTGAEEPSEPQQGSAAVDSWSTFDDDQNPLKNFRELFNV